MYVYPERNTDHLLWLKLGWWLEFWSRQTLSVGIVGVLFSVIDDSIRASTR